MFMTDVQNVEVQAEGASTLVDAQPANISTVVTTPQVDVPVEKQKNAGPGKAQTRKNQTGALNARFWPVTRITVGESASLTWQTITINPYTLSTRGESFNLPWRRNLWTGGSNSMGYLTTIIVQVITSRPPQVSGMIEFKDSTRGPSTRYHVELGGRIEFPVMIGVIANPVRPRHWNTPVVRTNESTVTIRYRLIAFNRTSDIADVTVNVNARPGHSTFHTPIKPKPRATSAFAQLAEDLEVLRFESDDNDYIAPPAGDEPEQGDVDDYDQEDNIDQDDYWIRAWEGSLIPGVPVAIPLNFSVIEDVSTFSDESTINQKFARFGHILPRDGDLGPHLGDYVIHTRLPTGVAASLAHVCLPDDVTDEVATRIFGLSGILDVATSALSALGGPLISGVVNTVPNLISGVVGNLLGGKPADTQQSESSEPAAVGGKIPIARFLQFLKPVAENLIEDPSFATLLLGITDLLSSDSTRAVTAIPVAVMVKMRSNVERNLYNRTITPLSSIENRVVIPQDRFSYIVEEFGYVDATFRENTRQNISFKKFMGSIVNRRRQRCVYLDEVMSYELTETENSAFQQLLGVRNRTPIDYESIRNVLRRDNSGS